MALMTAMTMPLIHTGRPWRTVYWIYTLPFVPYDYARGIWPNIRTPLVWDPSAVYTYLTSSILFVLVALIPDFAVLRDRTTGMSHRIYGMLAMGWQNLGHIFAPFGASGLNFGCVRAFEQC